MTLGNTCIACSTRMQVQLYESYQESSYYALIGDPPPGTTLNIVRAAKSDR